AVGDDPSSATAATVIATKSLSTMISSCSTIEHMIVYRTSHGRAARVKPSAPERTRKRNAQTENRRGGRRRRAAQGKRRIRRGVCQGVGRDQGVQRRAAAVEHGQDRRARAPHSGGRATPAPHPGQTGLCANGGGPLHVVAANSRSGTRLPFVLHELRSLP